MCLTLKNKRITVADGTSLNTVITSKHCGNKKGCIFMDFDTM